MKKTLSAVLLLIFSLLADDGFLGEVRMFAGSFPPRNWAFCDGQLLSIAYNQNLYSIIGTNYGGDGRTSFALPDLRGRAPISAGTGTGLSSYNIGQIGGAETVTLSENQLPQHTHSAEISVTDTVKIPVNNTDTESTSPNENYLGTTSLSAYADGTDGTYLVDPEVSTQSTVTVNNSGSSQGHINRSPYLAVNYIICLQGTTPSRN